MSAPSGWYPDPQPTVPGAPPLQRYWDGQAWTEHLAPVEQPGFRQPSEGSAAYPAGPGAGMAYYAGPPTTPDGVRLAGWWQRVGASLIDGLILLLVGGVLTFPLWRHVISDFGDFLDKAMAASRNGTPPPSSASFQRSLVGAVLPIALINLGVNLVYTVGFLRWKQATPGKLVMGLRVRLRERPELPLPTILVRWAVQSAVPGLVGLIPLIGTLTTLFRLLDDLWPLWDTTKQALHDKVAKTNVVRIR